MDAFNAPLGTAAVPTRGSGQGLIVGVPLYRAPEVVPGLFAALGRMGEELARLKAEIVLVNDSPADAGLDEMLQREWPALRQATAAALIVNSENLGFVRSANRLLALGLERGADVLLLNSDTIPRPGAFEEMASVAYLDPMIGVVSPRSDNATICNSPYLDALRGADLDENYAAHRRLTPHLPRYTYAPTAVGFCLYLRHAVLEEFGLFDEAYRAGYNEENDLIRRMNQCGYRAVLANHAYVHHLGEVSFEQSGAPRAAREAANRRILVERYPEFPALIHRYFEGAEYRAQRLLGGLLPEADGRLRLAFDCRFAGCYYSGTHEHAWALLRAFAADHGRRYRVMVVCDERAFRFHGLDRMAGLEHCREADALELPSAAVVRIGQPLREGDLPLLGLAAPVAGALMLDTIAMDCQQLDATDLDAIWNRTAAAVDFLAFNSRFTQEQFNRRFTSPDRVSQYVSRCSTDVRDYPTAREAVGSSILVVGNHYPHKHVRPMVEALQQADADRELLVLGVDVRMTGVESHQAGELPDAVVEGLYERASVVVLPSHYEGFGLPIMHGLARRRPVIARDLPFAREIKALCPQAVNLHLAGSTREMATLALAHPAWLDASPAEGGQGWDVAAQALADAVDEAIATFDFSVLRARQLDLVNRQARPGDAAALKQGFMLGEELRQGPLSHSGPEAARPSVSVPLALTPPWRELTARRLPWAGWISPLKLRDRSGELSIEAFHHNLLRWLDRLPVGGRLRLEIAALAGVEDDEFVGAIHSALLASGVPILDLARKGDVLVAHGIKRQDWRDAVSQTKDDRVFVQRLYQRFLGRDADEEGEANYARELAGGRDRRDVVRTFVTSPERLKLIRDQLYALNGGRA